MSVVLVLLQNQSLFFLSNRQFLSQILIIEWIHYKNDRQGLSLKFMNYTINPWVRRCYCIIGVFGFGAASNQLLTDIAKYTIGRLRPHFWDVCKPSVNCSLAINQNRYIEDFTCQGDNARLIRETRSEQSGIWNCFYKKLI